MKETSKIKYCTVVYYSPRPHFMYIKCYLNALNLVKDRRATNTQNDNDDLVCMVILDMIIIKEN